MQRKKSGQGRVSVKDQKGFYEQALFEDSEFFNVKIPMLAIRTIHCRRAEMVGISDDIID